MVVNEITLEKLKAWTTDFGVTGANAASGHPFGFEDLDDSSQSRCVGSIMRTIVQKFNEKFNCQVESGEFRFWEIHECSDMDRPGLVTANAQFIVNEKTYKFDATDLEFGKYSFQEI